MNVPEIFFELLLNIRGFHYFGGFHQEVKVAYLLKSTLLDCLPALQHDPNRPEDVLKVDADEEGIGGDDAADALRYLVARKPRTVRQEKLRGL